MKHPLSLTVAAALACSGCSSYVNSPAVARARDAKRAEFSDPLIARATNARPTMQFPATIAIAPNDQGVREHVRALSALGKIDALISLPQLARTTIISPAIIGETDREHRISADLRLREAAAKLHADAVLIIATETQATDGSIVAPLTGLSLGLLPNKRYELISTAFAALVDTRTGYIYGTDEKSRAKSGLTMAWGSDDVIRRARSKVERDAMEKLFADFPAFWRGVVATHHR
ncbi:MAG: hypothetical protein ABIP20_17055 [Chthoniobacteraceae bacterium]